MTATSVANCKHQPPSPDDNADGETANQRTISQKLGFDYNDERWEVDSGRRAMNTNEPSSLCFPDTLELAARQAEEFQHLPPQDRWLEIFAMMQFGLNMVRSSPRREFIEQRWLAQEQEWQ